MFCRPPELVRDRRQLGTSGGESPSGKGPLFSLVINLSAAAVQPGSARGTATSQHLHPLFLLGTRPFPPDLHPRTPARRPARGVRHSRRRLSTPIQVSKRPSCQVNSFPLTLRLFERKILIVTTLLFPAVMSTCTGSLSELRTSFLWGDVSWKSPSRPSGSRRKKSSQSRPKRSWSSCFQKFNYLGKTKTNANWNDVSNIWASDHCNVPNEFLNWTPKFLGNKCVFRPQVWLQKQASWAAQMKC